MPWGWKLKGPKAAQELGRKCMLGSQWTLCYFGMSINYNK